MFMSVIMKLLKFKYFLLIFSYFVSSETGYEYFLKGYYINEKFEYTYFKNVDRLNIY